MTVFFLLSCRSPLFCGAAFRCSLTAASAHSRKRVTYEINADHILTRDATGAAIVIPWSIMRRVVEGRSGLAIHLSPRGVRWLPKRPSRQSRLRHCASAFDKYSTAVRLGETETP